MSQTLTEQTLLEIIKNQQKISEINLLEIIKNQQQQISEITTILHEIKNKPLLMTQNNFTFLKKGMPKNLNNYNFWHTFF